MMDDTRTLSQLLTAALQSRTEILEAYLFGSRARGSAQPRSDIDVAVYLAPDGPTEVGFGYQAELTSHLMAVLATNRIDVVVLNDAPPLLYHRVLRDGERLLSRDLRQTTTREACALSRYCDYVPQLNKIRAALTDRIDSGEYGRGALARWIRGSSIGTCSLWIGRYKISATLRAGRSTNSRRVPMLAGPLSVAYSFAPRTHSTWPYTWWPVPGVMLPITLQPSMSCFVSR